MTLTLLNIVSIVVAVGLIVALIVTFVRLRRHARDVEGAIGIIEAPDEDVVDAANIRSWM